MKNLGSKSSLKNRHPLDFGKVTSVREFSCNTKIFAQNPKIKIFEKNVEFRRFSVCLVVFEGEIYQQIKNQIRNPSLCFDFVFWPCAPPKPTQVSEAIRLLRTSPPLGSDVLRAGQKYTPYFTPELDAAARFGQTISRLVSYSRKN